MVLQPVEELTVLQSHVPLADPHIKIGRAHV